MKKFLLKLALFFVLVAVLDVICGWGFDILRSKARGGQTHKNEYIANECVDDILILGSSKADHHYVPSVFEDSLGLTCYNAGEMGCGIIPAYVRYKMVSKRKKPKLVIYEVTPGYDYLVDDGYSSYLGVIRQYTDNKMVRDVYIDFSDELEGLRLLSNMYRNNSKLIMNAKDLLAKPDEFKGYEPLYGKMSTLKENSTWKQEKAISVDTLKWSYMERLVNETNVDEVPLVFMMSPQHRSIRVSDYKPFMEFCKNNGVPIINNQTSELFAGRRELFQDNIHLNHDGAVIYSKSVISQIKLFIKK